MPIASHTRAAHDHTAAATAHDQAAALHAKGDHTAALEGSTKAKGCCDTASQSSTDAHAKSVSGAKT
jgi:hypothetical protein